MHLNILPKPFDLDELLNLVSNTFLFNTKIKKLITNIEGRYSSKSIYDSGPVLENLLQCKKYIKLISRIVNTDLTVLISGESGTGKN